MANEFPAGRVIDSHEQMWERVELLMGQMQAIEKDNAELKARIEEVERIVGIKPMIVEKEQRKLPDVPF